MLVVFLVQAGKGQEVELQEAGWAGWLEVELQEAGWLEADC